MKICWGDVESGTVRFCGDVAATASDFLLRLLPSIAPCFIQWSSCRSVSQNRDSCQPGSRATAPRQRSAVKRGNPSDTSAPLPWDLTQCHCVCVCVLGKGGGQLIQ